MEKNAQWNPSLKGFLTEALRRSSKLRLALIGLIGLWIVVGTKLVTEKLLYREQNLKAAMAVAKPGQTTGTISFVGRLPEPFLTEHDQRELIYYAAKKLELVLTSEPTVLDEENQSGFVFRKRARYADTSIKVLSRPQSAGEPAVYLIITLSLWDDNGDGILFYRDKMNEIARELSVQDEQTSLQLTGSFRREMTLTAKNRLTDRILDKLHCQVVCENREDDLFTVYAYTNGLDEYILLDKERINLQVAMYYDEKRDKTVLCVASPVITGEIVNTAQK